MKRGFTFNIYILHVISVQNVNIEFYTRYRNIAVNKVTFKCNYPSHHYCTCWFPPFSCLCESAKTCPCSLTSLNMERNELRPSEEAPPKIHNSSELNEFMLPGLGPVSGCWRSGCPGISIVLPTRSGLLFSERSGPGASTLFVGGIAWLDPGLKPGPEVASVLGRLGFLVFNLVICNVDARMVDEVMWKSGCCWSWVRLFWMNLCRAGTWDDISKRAYKIKLKFWNILLKSKIDGEIYTNDKKIWGTVRYWCIHDAQPLSAKRWTINKQLQANQRTKYRNKITLIGTNYLKVVPEVQNEVLHKCSSRTKCHIRKSWKNYKLKF